MSVCGQDFIDFAELCVSHGNEIGYRNAMGRAYYGIYHQVCEVLEKCPENASHQDIRDYLTRTAWLKGYEPFDKMKLISLGTVLRHMHTRRKWADYELQRDLSKADADAAIIMAKANMLKVKEMYEEVYPPAPAA